MQDGLTKGGLDSKPGHHIRPPLDTLRESCNASVTRYSAGDFSAFFNLRAAAAPQLFALMGGGSVEAWKGKD